MLADRTTRVGCISRAHDPVAMQFVDLGSGPAGPEQSQDGRGQMQKQYRQTANGLRILAARSALTGFGFRTNFG